MANIPALAGYQTSNGEIAPAKFGVSDVLTDPNGNILLTSPTPGAGSIVLFDTPLHILDHSNTVYNGAAKGSPWNFGSVYAFNGALDLSGLTSTPAIPANAKAVLMGGLPMLYNTVGGTSRGVSMYVAKTQSAVPKALAIPPTSAYHLANIGGGSIGAEYNSCWGMKLVNVDTGIIIGVSAYSNNSPNAAYWYFSIFGFTV